MDGPRASGTVLGEAVDPARRVWLFDLDNTLYPASCNLFGQIERNMTSFVSTRLGLEFDAARALQKDLFRRYGTTLRGLMSEHDVPPHDFMDAAHRIDLAHVPRDPALDLALSRLPGRKLVFTNGSVAHAENVLVHLGLERHFEAVFDIAAAEWLPKPQPEPYLALFKRHAVTPAHAVMFDDIPANLHRAAEFGVTTVLVDEGCGPDAPAPLPPIHHVTHDLAWWLEQQIGETTDRADG